MKKGTLLLLILAGILLGLFFGKSTVKQLKLISPVLGVSKIGLADNLWLPKESLFDFNLLAPKVSAKGVFFVDTQTGQVLYSKNPHQKLPIASLAKIMTVIIAMENHQFEDKIKISNQAAGMEPDKMQLIAGETLSVEELLGGIFLVSANDAAEALAEATTPRKEEFVALMNSKASQIGMKDTLFINPTGLEEDLPNPDDGVKDQYSSAFDVTLMSRYAIKKWPHLVDISSQNHIYLGPTNVHQDYDLYSGVNLLTTYPGVVGFKTGYTPEAGLTLVTLARLKGYEILGVILGSGDRRGEAKELLDYSFKKLGVKI